MKNLEEIIKVVRSITEKMEKEYQIFKAKEFAKTPEEVYNDNIKIFTYENLFGYFENKPMDEIAERFYKWNFNDKVYRRIANIENWLFELYDYEMGYDGAYHTGTWEEIEDFLFMFLTTYENDDTCSDLD